jgi:single-strand DNA-binding protein
MFNKLVRIGRDAELRVTPNNKSVIGLSCVYDIGWGDNKKSQWVEAVIWGKQAESLAPYLLKGKQIVIYADDVEIETYQKSDGTQASKLKCRVINIDLTSSGDNQQQNNQQQPQQQSQQQPQQRQQPQQQNQGCQQNGGGGLDDSFDQDIPF